MQRSILRDLGILLGIFALVWLVASLFSYPENPQLLSSEKEEKLGQTYVELLQKNPIFKACNDDRIDSAVDMIGSRLRQGLGRSDYHYSFFVFENEMINAFTVPGGNILLSTALIGFCETPEELAAVMAHEMGHVENRHVIARLIKELGLELLTSGDPYVMGEVSELLTSTHFDRRQEEEADHFASELLERSAIEPRTLATFFRRLEAEKDNEMLEQFEIFSTHPNIHARIRDALSYQPAEGFEARSIQLDWPGITTGL